MNYRTIEPYMQDHNLEIDYNSFECIKSKAGLRGWNHVKCTHVNIHGIFNYNIYKLPVNDVIYYRYIISQLSHYIDAIDTEADTVKIDNKLLGILGEAT